jgi:hypothetical protein
MAKPLHWLAWIWWGIWKYNLSINTILPRSRVVLQSVMLEFYRLRLVWLMFPNLLLFLFLSEIKFSLRSRSNSRDTMSGIQGDSSQMVDSFR